MGSLWPCRLDSAYAMASAKMATFVFRSRGDSMPNQVVGTAVCADTQSPKPKSSTAITPAAPSIAQRLWMISASRKLRPGMWREWAED